MEKLNPLLRYPGSKYRLGDYFSMMSPYASNYNKYAEPFFGSGGFFCHIAPKENVEQIYISDTDGNLINFYQCVQYNCLELYEAIERIKAESDGSAEAYYELRNQFNDNRAYGNPTQAARFYLLNRNCFNGLVRYNKKGEFNSPYKRIKDWTVAETPGEDFAAWERVLQKAEIWCCDYSLCKDFVDSRTLVFLDPPYYVEHADNKFSYGGKGHTREFHEKLYKFFELLNDKGALLMETNSSEYFLCDLYWKYYRDVFKAPYIINSKAKERKDVEQLLIYNFGF